MCHLRSKKEILSHACILKTILELVCTNPGQWMYYEITVYVINYPHSYIYIAIFIPNLLHLYFGILFYNAVCLPWVVPSCSTKLRLNVMPSAPKNKNNHTVHAFKSLRFFYHIPHNLIEYVALNKVFIHKLEFTATDEWIKIVD